MVSSEELSQWQSCHIFLFVLYLASKVKLRLIVRITWTNYLSLTQWYILIFCMKSLDFKSCVIEYLYNTTGTAGRCYCDKGTRTWCWLTTGTVCIEWFASIRLGYEVGSMRMNWGHRNTWHWWWWKWWVTSLDYSLASWNTKMANLLMKNLTLHHKWI